MLLLKIASSYHPERKRLNAPQEKRLLRIDPLTSIEMFLVMEFLFKNNSPKLPIERAKMLERWEREHHYSLFDRKYASDLEKNYNECFNLEVFDVFLRVTIYGKEQFYLSLDICKTPYVKLRQHQETLD